MSVKKVVILNSFDFGSTGSICKGIKKVLEKNGVETWFFCETWKQKKKPDSRMIYLGTKVGNYLSSKLERFGFARNPFNHSNAKKIIREIKRINPDIVSIHNLHNNFIDLKTIFDFFKKSSFSVVWTLHDCWSFTGRCPHFLLTECQKWKTGCYKCPYPKNLYPYALIDNTKKMWTFKKNTFLGAENLFLVTPSQWLCDLLKNSFLCHYKSKKINNGIDLQKFKHHNPNIRDKYNIPSYKYILLGVSLGWSYSKGLDRFNTLAELLPNNYQILLVGVGESEREFLSDKILAVPKTKTKEELAEYYSSADLFVNPTREDNFPTVNIESLACGTPVLTSNIGGCPEIIDETCGISIDFNDIGKVKNAITEICNKRLFSPDSCIKRASMFDENIKFDEYYELFKKLSGDKEQ